MTAAMSPDDNSGDESAEVDVTRTTIEVDRDVWREVRKDSVAEGLNVSEMLEKVLREYYGMQSDNTDSN